MALFVDRALRGEVAISERMVLALSALNLFAVGALLVAARPHVVLVQTKKAVAVRAQVATSGFMSK